MRAVQVKRHMLLRIAEESLKNVVIVIEISWIVMSVVPPVLPLAILCVVLNELEIQVVVPRDLPRNRLVLIRQVAFLVSREIHAVACPLFLSDRHERKD